MMKNSFLYLSLVAIYASELTASAGQVEVTAKTRGGLRSQLHSRPIPIESETSRSVAAVPGGYSVTCIGGDGKIYRYEDGVLYHYPSGTIAASWDTNWRSPQWIDCTGLSYGDPLEEYIAPTASPTNMPIPNIGVPHGTAVRCIGDSSYAIYRWHHGKLRHYPSGDIANSWDDKWRNPRDVDCSGLQFGPPMEMWAPTAAPTPSPVRNGIQMTNGSTYRCSGDTSTAYRWSNNKLYPYSDSAVADSWDSNWRDSQIVDCTGLNEGTTLSYKPADDMTVACQDNTYKLYWHSSGELRHFPSGSIAYSWDPNFRNPQIIDCATLTYGPDMVMYGTEEVENGGDNLTDGTGTVDTTTTSSTGTTTTTGSTTTSTGTTDTSGTAGTVDTTSDGTYQPKSVQCTDLQDYKVYRLASGELRHYPSAEIAASWDPNWRSFESVVCEGYTIGNALDMFDPNVDPTRPPTKAPTIAPTKSPTPFDVCTVAEELSLFGTTDEAKTQDLCIASQWAVTFFDEKKPKIMERITTKLQEASTPVSDPEFCGCLAACQSTSVLCEIACVLAPIGPCGNACEAALVSCEAKCQPSIFRN
mmetsp:Transcript_14996/g.22693  ORF Transcript_14996/g.22693 Transcript_14996/m.22693 type:complete len:584 (-) Transcript_14996:181-1932(-)